MDRRDFIKIGGAAAIAGGLSACKPVADKNGDNSENLATGTMEIRRDKDNNVGLLGYGCMRWQMVKDKDGKEIIDQDSVNELVDYALAHGVNYFDSAPVYLQGQSEKAAGIALSRHPRESYYIATKLSNFSDSSYEASVAMYRKSLENFNTDHIDYYLLHSIDGLGKFRKRFGDNGLMDFLLKEREEGHIRRLGFSFHGNAEGFMQLMELHEKYHWDFVQIQMNYVDWNHVTGKYSCNASFMYEKLSERGIPVIIMEPLLGGRLAKLPDALAKELKEREPDRTLASWAFRFTGTFPDILTVLSGMTYMEHLQDNLKTFCGFDPLDEEEIAFLDRIADRFKKYPLVNCTGCDYCMPCPYGIDIPGIFIHYNACVNEGITPGAPDENGYKAMRRKYLTSYNKAVETFRQADHCIGCKRCQPLCPQHIRIPDELQRIDRYIETLKRQ